MFESTPVDRLVEEVRAYDFGSDPVHEAGANRIDAIRELDRAIRAAQAEQVAQIGALHAERNRADQRVSYFPESDGVAALHVRGPAEHLLAAFNALDAWASTARAGGDTRTRGQIMCQTLVERVTGLRYADEMDVEIGLVMGAETFVGGDDPVDLVGYGPISPDVADGIIARATSAAVRRFLTDPVDGTLLVREPRRRFFDARTSSHVHARDRRCRQPGNGAIAWERIAAMEDRKIRHKDHIVEHQHGGLSVKENGQGLCERSHTIRHQPGWSVRSDGNATIWRTPTGHEYRSAPTRSAPDRSDPDRSDPDRSAPQQPAPIGRVLRKG